MGTLDKPRQVTKIYEFYVPVSALALGGRTKKHESSYPGAKCQKKSQATNNKNMLGNVEKNMDGAGPKFFFSLPGTNRCFLQCSDLPGLIKCLLLMSDELSFYIILHLSVFFCICDVLLGRLWIMCHAVFVIRGVC